MLLKVVLSIAGSDSGGGAGVQADLKTFLAHRVFGITAITAITAQNTQGISLVHPLPASVVAAQLDSLFSDFQIDAIKLGMLVNLEILEVLAVYLKKVTCPIILDPVLSATSGSSLLALDSVDFLQREIFPYMTVFTPNIPEANFFTHLKISSQTPNEIIHQELKKIAPRAAVLLKGGHLPADNYLEKFVIDRLFFQEKEYYFVNPYIDTKNLHGTGCTLASSIAAELAKGASIPKAVETATSFVHQAILTAIKIGNGNGPINHSFCLT